jgi:hypothetical protein
MCYGTVLDMRSFIAPALVVVLCGAVITGCGHGGAPSSTQTVPTPVPPTTTVSVDVARFNAFVRAQQYTPDRQLVLHLTNDSSLIVIQAICTGSADGHCQAVFVFKDGQHRPVWRRDFNGILGLTLTKDGFVVRSPHYAPDDPLCCPSLPDQETVAHWSGNQIHTTTTG